MEGRRELRLPNGVIQPAGRTRQMVRMEQQTLAYQEQSAHGSWSAEKWRLAGSTWWI